MVFTYSYFTVVYTNMETQISSKIKEVLKELSMDDIDFVVEHPNELSNGDYSSNVAMVGAKLTKQNPKELAEAIKEKLDGKIKLVREIEVAGPGFLNFHLDRSFYSNKIEEILEQKENWGTNDSQKGEVVLIEYTSPNLFKPLHIGNLVGNIIGESVVRLYEGGSAEVKRINYPSDIGLTVAKGVWGLQKTGGDPTDVTALGEAYRAGNEAYENDESAQGEIKSINKALYEGSNEELNSIREKGINTSKEAINKLCEMLGTTFDAEIFESETVDIGLKLVKEGVESKVFEESDGAIVFHGEKAGLHTRVFINSQGLPTYEAKDVGNFAIKNEKYPNWTQSIIVTGSEQKEYFKVIIEAIRTLFPENRNKVMEHIPTGFLTLTTGKMSSRKGDVLTGESLINEMIEEASKKVGDAEIDDKEKLVEEIAVAAFKYQILRQKVGSDIVFDKERALSFEGNSGPYLQYTHARINTVIKKASELGMEQSTAVKPEQPYDIEKLIYQFDGIVKKSLDETSPHHLVVFLTELAGAFNSFYANERIADVSDPNAPYKMAVALATQQTLKNGLFLLGIKCPDRM